MVALSYVFLFIGWTMSVIYYFYKLPSSYQELRKDHGLFFSTIWCVIDMIVEVGVSLVVGATSINYFANESVFILGVCNILAAIALVFTIWFFWKNRKNI